MSEFVWVAVYPEPRVRHLAADLDEVGRHGGRRGWTLCSIYAWDQVGLGAERGPNRRPLRIADLKPCRQCTQRAANRGYCVPPVEESGP